MYQIIQLYTDEEIKFLRTMIEGHVKSMLDLRSLTLKNYHRDVNENQHKILSDKRMRVFHAHDAIEIEKFKGTQRLLENNPGYRIADIVYNSSEREPRPEFYFRLVRPGYPGDVGAPHCDFWFDAAMGTEWGIGNTIKLWIPIEIEPGLNGLFFFPDAPAQVPFTILEKDGFKRPQIGLPFESLGAPVLPCPLPGQALKFYDNVLHAGAPNKGSSTRVSIEITLIREP